MKLILSVTLAGMLLAACGQGGPHGPPKSVVQAIGATATSAL